jgi:glutaredoxin
MLTVYSKNHCPFCDRTKALLRKYDVEFEEIKIDESVDAREFVINEGHRTVPQIYLNGQLFVEGGYTGLSKLTEEEIKDKVKI